MDGYKIASTRSHEGIIGPVDRIKLWHIILAACLVRLAFYIGVNVLYVGLNTFEHPDSDWYIKIAKQLSESWQSDFRLFPYPEYANVLAIYPVRYFGESINLLTSIGTVVVAYVTLNTLDPRGHSATIGAAIVALDPYMAYLSTQVLRDSLIIAAVAITASGFTSGHHIMTLTGLMGASYFRVQLGVALSVLTIGYLVIRKQFRHAAIVAIVLLLAILALQQDTAPKMYAYMIAKVTGYQIEFAPGPTRTDIDVHVATIKSHREFYDNRRPSLELIPFLTNTTDLWFFPHWWEADNAIEVLFGIYMAYWYILSAAGVAAIIWTRSRDGMELFIFAMLLGLPLTWMVISQGSFVRWRLSPYYIFMLAYAIGFGRAYAKAFVR